MRTLKRIYDWCLVKTRRILGAITLFLPRGKTEVSIKLRWLGKRTRSFVMSVILALSAMLFMCPGIIRLGGSGGGSGIPLYTYSGVSSMIDDGSGNWRLRLLSSGTLVVTSGSITIDVFVVGAGAGGGVPGVSGAGGGAGYTGTWSSITLQKDTSYSVVVGAGGAPGSSGGTSIAFSVYTEAGGGSSNSSSGGNGGSGGGGFSGGWGGVGGADGNNGGNVPGYGQGTTTREFGVSGATLYAGGGGGAGGAAGGAGGGGADGVAGTANTGGGGGYGAYGGSGIVVIRNHRAA